MCPDDVLSLVSRNVRRLGTGGYIPRPLLSGRDGHDTTQMDWYPTRPSVLPSYWSRGLLDVQPSRPVTVVSPMSRGRIEPTGSREDSTGLGQVSSLTLLFTPWESGWTGLRNLPCLVPVCLRVTP